MTTTTASNYDNGYTVRVELTARAVDLEADAQRAADAVAAWLLTQPPITDLPSLRAEFASAAEGEIDGLASEDTAYGRLINSAAEVAEKAATQGWANSRAEVVAFVDIA